MEKTEHDELPFDVSYSSVGKKNKNKIKMVMGAGKHRCSEAEEAVSSLKRILHTPCIQRCGTHDSLKGQTSIFALLGVSK